MKITLHHIRTSLLSIATVLIMSCPAIFLASCSNKNLSRGKAAELISRSLNLPVGETMQLGKSFLKKSWNDPSNFPAACIGSGDKYSDVKVKLDELQAKGLISVGENQQHQGECNWLWATVKLTDAGREFLVSETDGGYKVKVDEIVFGDVTGIQINEQFKVAIATYTLKKANTTPFGSNASSEPMNRQAEFALFDDGWRIQR